jgi:hypothetical protein
MPEAYYSLRFRSFRCMICGGKVARIKELAERRVVRHGKCEGQLSFDL